MQHQQHLRPSACMAMQPELSPLPPPLPSLQAPTRGLILQACCYGAKQILLKLVFSPR